MLSTINWAEPKYPRILAGQRQPRFFYPSDVHVFSHRKLLFPDPQASIPSNFSIQWITISETGWIHHTVLNLLCTTGQRRHLRGRRCRHRVIRCTDRRRSTLRLISPVGTLLFMHLLEITSTPLPVSCRLY